MEASRTNYKKYTQGKEPLKNAVLQHPTGNKIYDYLKKNVNRTFWIVPFNEWQKQQKYRK